MNILFIFYILFLRNFRKIIDVSNCEESIKMELLLLSRKFQDSNHLVLNSCPSAIIPVKRRWKALRNKEGKRNLIKSRHDLIVISYKRDHMIYVNFITLKYHVNFVSVNFPMSFFFTIYLQVKSYRLEWIFHEHLNNT